MPSGPTYQTHSRSVTWGPLPLHAPWSETALILGRGEHSFHDDRKWQSFLLVLFLPVDMGAPLRQETPGVNPSS